MKTKNLKRNGNIEQAHLNMMGFELPDPEVTNKKLPKSKQPTARVMRGISKREWMKYQKRAERSTLQLQKDLERRGLTKGRPIVGRDVPPNYMFA